MFAILIFLYFCKLFKYISILQLQHTTFYEI